MLLGVLEAHAPHEEPKRLVASDIAREMAEFLDERLSGGREDFPVNFTTGQLRTRKSKK